MSKTIIKAVATDDKGAIKEAIFNEIDSKKADILKVKKIAVASSIFNKEG